MHRVRCPVGAASRDSNARDLPRLSAVQCLPWYGCPRASGLVGKHPACAGKIAGRAVLLRPMLADGVC